MNKNYIGHEYFCSVCKTQYTMTEDLLDEVELKHEIGEELTIVTAECANCGTMSIPEGMNQITWLMPKDKEE